MQRLVSARLDADWPAINFHPGDVDWFVFTAGWRVPPLTERLRLWFDAGSTLVGYAWLSPPADLDFLVAPSPAVSNTDDLIREMAEWGEANRFAIGGDAVGSLRLLVATGDERAMGSSARLGFVPEGQAEVVNFTGDLTLADAWPDPMLPDGMAVRRLETDAQIEARVICAHAAFPNSTTTAERYRGVRDAWLYRADLDLQIVTPDGDVAAFALGWLDDATSSVELEPVGVHPDWHRRGLGGEICRAVLRAAQGLGARRAMVTAERSNPAAIALYASLGLEMTSEIVALVRPTIFATTEMT